MNCLHFYYERTDITNVINPVRCNQLNYMSKDRSENSLIDQFQQADVQDLDGTGHARGGFAIDVPAGGR